MGFGGASRGGACAPGRGSWLVRGRLGFGVPAPSIRGPPHSEPQHPGTRDPGAPGTPRPALGADGSGWTRVPNAGLSREHGAAWRAECPGDLETSLKPRGAAGAGGRGRGAQQVPLTPPPPAPPLRPPLQRPPAREGPFPVLPEPCRPQRSPCRPRADNPGRGRGEGPGGFVGERRRTGPAAGPGAKGCGGGAGGRTRVERRPGLRLRVVEELTATKTVTQWRTHGAARDESRGDAGQAGSALSSRPGAPPREFWTLF